MYMYMLKKDGINSRAWFAQNFLAQNLLGVKRNENCLKSREAAWRFLILPQAELTFQSLAVLI